MTTEKDTSEESLASPEEAGEEKLTLAVLESSKVSLRLEMVRVTLLVREHSALTREVRFIFNTFKEALLHPLCTSVLDKSTGRLISRD